MTEYVNILEHPLFKEAFKNNPINLILKEDWQFSANSKTPANTTVIEFTEQLARELGITLSKIDSDKKIGDFITSNNHVVTPILVGDFLTLDGQKMNSETVFNRYYNDKNIVPTWAKDKLSEASLIELRNKTHEAFSTTQQNHLVKTIHSVRSQLDNQDVQQSREVKFKA